MGLSENELEPPLDDIAFLSRSNHRVDVLLALDVEGRTRRDLREVTGSSQPTIGRILDGFLERGWIEQTDRVYQLTPLGRVIAREFNELMASVRSVQTLHDLAPQLPFDAFDFDLDRLTSARITQPSVADATRHVRREQELAENAERIRFFCNSAHPHTVEVYRDRVVEDGQQLEAIIADEALDAAYAEPEMRDYLQDLLASDRATIYQYDGVVDVMVGLLDDVAVIQPIDAGGMPVAIIESTDDNIRTWAENEIEARRREATLVDPDALPA